MNRYILKKAALQNIDNLPGPRTAVLKDNRARIVQRKRASSPTEEINAPATPRANAVIQRAKRKRAKYTVGGGIGMGLIGAGIGSVIPGVGTLTGGLVGMVMGGIGGYLYSKPKIYTNIHKDEYKNELRALRLHQEGFKNSKNIHEKGTIIKYSGSNQKRFLSLLSRGHVLYTYDKNNQLSIGSGISAMKHALVAGNEDVKAAGWARPQQSTKQKNEQEYQRVLGKLELFGPQKERTEMKALSILKKYKLELNDYSSIPNDEEKQIVGQYKTAIEHLELYRPVAQELMKLDREESGVTKSTAIQVDNESGHYQPGTDSKDEAFEGWRNAGFTNLLWKAWKRKTH